MHNADTPTNELMLGMHNFFSFSDH